MLSLADIERAPERIAELSPDEAISLATRIAAIQMSLILRGQSRMDIGAVRLLNLAEASRRMSVTEYWLRTHAHDLPFAVKMGKAWRFNEAGLAKYLIQRQQG
jgi:hypothetical protein